MSKKGILNGIIIVAGYVLGTTQPCLHANNYCIQLFVQGSLVPELRMRGALGRLVVAAWTKKGKTNGRSLVVTAWHYTATRGISVKLVGDV